MKKKKDIIVWDQFAKAIDKDSDSSKSKESIPTFTRNYEEDKGKSVFQLIRKIKHFKPIILAVFSALFIGSVLGFFLLNLLTNINGDSNLVDKETTTNQAIHYDKNDQPKDDQRQLFTLDGMNAQVLQVGVFSKKENAKEWLERFEEKGFPATIWERDDQFFLFAGVAHTTDVAHELMTDIKDKDFDVFVKEWTTKEIEVEVSKEDYEWLTSFQELWKKTLVSDEINIDDWTNLQKMSEKDSEDVTELKEDIKHLLEKNIKEEPLRLQKYLLSIWNQFEGLFYE